MGQENLKNKNKMTKFLTENCNKLKNGTCHSLNCLKRGGYVRGVSIAGDHSIATCEILELHKFLEIRKDNGDLCHFVEQLDNILKDQNYKIFQ